ncbi:hypothetical protein [Actinomadura chokoriensis]|uniref:Uncharacterized protein n=1 Tax=Actinomadura chokoriensis TaxID=454156 RepID=A0ABV4R1Z8_9ACTN
MTRNPWEWREGRNPYRETAFQILDLAPDVAGRAAIDSVVRKRRNRVQRAPERYRLFGRTLSVAEVNEAAAQLGDAELRLLAELRTHQTETSGAVAPPDPLPEPPPAPPMPLLDPRRLPRLAPDPGPRTFPQLWPYDED